MNSNETTPATKRAGYSAVAIILHWLIAALVVFEVGLGLNMEAAKGADKFAVFQLHKSVGITILLLLLLRIVWRFYRQPPALTATGWEKALARLVHAAFYLILLALPVSGWIIVSASKIAVPTLLYGTVPWPHLPGFADMAAAARQSWHEAGEFVHGNLVNLIYLLFALHIAGALKHHFIDRDGDLARMVPGARAGAWAEPRLLAIAATVIGAAALGLGWQAAVAPRPLEVPEAAPVPSPSALASQAATPVELAASAAATAIPSANAISTTPASSPAEQVVSSWAISSGSSIRFRTSWGDEAINGGFTGFSGDIVFSPDLLDKSAVTVTVDTTSVFSGDGQRDSTLKGDEWFASGANRNAVFRASRFRKTGTDRYVAEGTLRIKGVTLPITVPFTLRIAGNEATMQGSATIDRLAYKIGEGEYAGTSEIPAAVAIDLVVKARRK